MVKKLLRNKFVVFHVDFFCKSESLNHLDGTYWCYPMYSIQSCFSHVCNSSYKYGLPHFQNLSLILSFSYLFSYFGCLWSIRNQQTIHHRNNTHGYLDQMSFYCHNLSHRDAVSFLYRIALLKNLFKFAFCRFELLRIRMCFKHSVLSCHALVFHIVRWRSNSIIQEFFVLVKNDWTHS